jgi:hypothetical protein
LAGALLPFPVLLSHQLVFFSFGDAYKEQKQFEEREKEYNRHRILGRKRRLARMTRQDLQDRIIEEMKYMSEELKTASAMMNRAQEKWAVIGTSTTVTFNLPTSFVHVS